MLCEGCSAMVCNEKIRGRAVCEGAESPALAEHYELQYIPNIVHYLSCHLLEPFCFCKRCENIHLRLRLRRGTL